MRCPAGHETTATDYCDTCGIAMDAVPTGGADQAPSGQAASGQAASGQAASGQAASGQAPAPAADSAPSSGACPHCQTVNPANALFCENCGYDFTTGSLPRPLDPVATSPLDLGAAAPADTVVPAVATGNLSPAPAETWVAEIWIDPDWYVDQQSTDPLPSPGLPVVVALKHTSALIGRASRSRGITPDLDLGSDSGISRRHAQLTTDGSRWFVEDLGSSNGTYVGGDLGTLPKTPVPVGQKEEISGDERVYLGAWTRIVIRKAAPGEV